MGLVILGALVIYGLVSIVVVLLAIRHAKKNGRGAARWGWGAALVMYLIPFWDWLPTVGMHRYNCATQSGFWVYKTPEQWTKENPGVMESLVTSRRVQMTRQGDVTNHTDTYFLNSRINWIVKESNEPLLNQWRHEQELMDTKTGEVLARYVGFSTAQIRAGGGWYGWKFWLHSEHCNEEGRDASLMREFKNKFRGVEK
jgi:hypothetical protein